MDKALMEVATGTFSLDHALEDTLMTGFAHASQEQTKNMTKKLDVYTFEVSALGLDQVMHSGREKYIQNLN